MERRFLCRGPDGLIHLIGLSAKKCQKDAKLLDDKEINQFRNQTPGDAIEMYKESRELSLQS